MNLHCHCSVYLPLLSTSRISITFFILHNFPMSLHPCQPRDASVAWFFFSQKPCALWFLWSNILNPLWLFRTALLWLVLSTLFTPILYSLSATLFLISYPLFFIYSSLPNFSPLSLTLILSSWVISLSSDWSYLLDFSIIVSTLIFDSDASWINLDSIGSYQIRLDCLILDHIYPLNSIFFSLLSSKFILRTYY